MNSYSIHLPSKRTSNRLFGIRGLTATVLALALSACGGSSSGDAANDVNVVPAAETPSIEAPDTDSQFFMLEEIESPVDEVSATGIEERSGVTIIFPAGTTLEEHESPFLAVAPLFQIASRPSTTGDVTVELLQFNDNVRLTTIADFYELPLDVCSIRDLNPVVSNEEEEDTNDSFTLVSGGENLVLTSAGGTWASVPYSVIDEQYFGNNILPAAIPSDLSLSLSGDVFPALSVPLSVPTAPQRLSPGIREAVSTASEYRWIPDDDSSTIRISFLSYLNGVFQGFPINCVVEDDGEFALPADILAEVERLSGELIVRYIRTNRQVVFQNDVAIFSAVGIADD